MSPSPGARVRAPAKINLALRVAPRRRRDGFHDVATLYQAVDLYDDLVAEPRDDQRVTVQTLDAEGRTVPGIYDDGRHLAVRAAQALRRRVGVSAGVHLRVCKRIPVAAGLAGGSADAAAALVGCASLWRLGIGRAGLLDVAAALGSDAPFALLGGAAIGTGRGERLDPVPVGGGTTWLLISFPSGLATGTVYAENDRLRHGRDDGVPRVDPGLLAALAQGDLPALADGLHNDLQAAAVALRPELVPVLDAGRRAGALGTLVAGSGPSLLLLVADDAHAGGVAAAVRPAAAEALAGATVRTVHGPVPGATIAPATMAPWPVPG